MLAFVAEFQMCRKISWHVGASHVHIGHIFVLLTPYGIPNHDIYCSEIAIFENDSDPTPAMLAMTTITAQMPADLELHAVE